MLPSKQLTPEQRQAVQVLADSLPFWDDYLCSVDELQATKTCCSNFKAFLTEQISYSDLHHGPTWFWNQSNAKKYILFDDGVRAVMQKYNTRKLNKAIPSDGMIFKLWLFFIYRSDNSFLGVFVWCEKGLSPSHEQHNNSSENFDFFEVEQAKDLKLEDLNFLRQFVDEETAISLGW